MLFKSFSYHAVPTPPYTGQQGPLPFQDPLWKILLGVLAGLISIGGSIYDALTNGSAHGGSSSQCVDEVTGEVVPCSLTDSSITSDNYVTAAIFAAAAAVATIAAASDGIDPHLAGQRYTPPATATELTTGELVQAKINYLAPPSPGVIFPIEISWKYTRTTTAQVYNYNMDEAKENTHVLKSYTVKVPATWDRQNGPMLVLAQFLKSSGEIYSGGALYVRGLMGGPDGIVRVFDLKDDGLQPDGFTRDGWYTGQYEFRRSTNDENKRDPPGVYYLLVIAQEDLFYFHRW
jgi:hypothetical protein